jgi:amino acid transporter
MKHQQLGPLLCWAVVFADIGTSVYYVPGILYGTVGKLAGFFVFLTMVVFILLTLKYVEVTYRFPQGGGVVTVAAVALNRWFGALGGMFILVDYFLTAAISGLSGMLYLGVVIPAISPLIALWLTIIVLVLLGILNWVGVSESAKVSLIGALIAFASDIAILFTVFTHISFAQFLALLPQMFTGKALTPFSILTGFAGSFLAFSGLESISQLSPEMKLPRRTVGKIALFLVVITVGLTSPLLTLLSTLLLPRAAGDPVLSSQIISLLGGHFGGFWGSILQTEVAVSASALLVFASNTAIIGSYHVFTALSRMQFFPAFIQKRNKLHGTPHYSIAFAVGIPIVILLIVRGNIGTLGDMYAFGLLGAFSLTCISMDIVRVQARRERKRQAAMQKAVRNTPEEAPKILDTSHIEESGATVQGAEPDERPEPEGRWTRSQLNFWLGVLTTVLVIVAWSTNLVTKLVATEFGGSVTILGMLIAYFNYRYHKKRERISVVVTSKEKLLPGATLVVLPAGEQHNVATIQAAVHDQEKPLVFLFLGKDVTYRRSSFFSPAAPHLRDKEALDTLAQANYLAQQAHLPSRFVYHHLEPDAASQAWHVIQPADTLIAADQTAMLKNIQADQVTYEETPQGKIAHFIKKW